jgi:hypothetical protein
MAGPSPAMTMSFQSENDNVPHPNDPKLRSFIDVDPASDFPIQNLPYGVFSPRTASPRASASRSAITCSISGSSSRTAGSMSARSACSRRRRSIPFMALGPKSGRDAGADQRAVAPRHPELRDNPELRERALVPMADAKLHLPIAVPATPISIRRRSTPPMSASCSAARTMRCSRTGCICRSATTAAHRPSWSAAPRCGGRAGS